MFGFLAGIIDWFKGFFGKSTQDQVKEIQELTKKFCAFLPTFDSVLAMITAPNPQVVGARAIAEAICKVVGTSAPLQAKGMPDAWSGTVNGVVVEGERVK